MKQERIIIGDVQLPAFFKEFDVKKLKDKKDVKIFDWCSFVVNSDYFGWQEAKISQRLIYIVEAYMGLRRIENLFGENQEKTELIILAYGEVARYFQMKNGLFPDGHPGKMSPEDILNRLKNINNMYVMARLRQRRIERLNYENRNIA